MHNKITRKILQKRFFVFFMAIGFGLACSSSLLAAPAKSDKSSSTHPVVRPDPADWKKVVEAAKKEGKIVIGGVPGEGWRKSMVDLFQQEYPDIKVEYSTTPGRNLWPRIRKERELGKKLWDLYGGGIGTTWDPKKDGLLAPIRPLLLPEIADDTKWIGGLDRLFNDKERQYLPSYLLYIQPSVYVNRDFIKESDIKASEQLLDPKFRGKIVILNPTGGSSRKSIGHLAFMYGENFIRELLTKQDVIVTDDNRQQVEWTVRGKYPISIGFELTLLIPFQKQGLGMNIRGLEDKMIRTTSGSGAIGLLEGAPHPNAVRVYINWLLSQKTLMKLTKNVGHSSSRIDVPNIEAPIDLTKLSMYRSGDTEEAEAFMDGIVPIIKESLKK